MPLLTYKQARDSRDLAAVMGVCPTSLDGREYLNKAVRMLMNRGNFWGTVQLMRGCVFNQCITWPRYVGTVLAMNMCGANVPVWNNWYEFLPIGTRGIMHEGFRIVGTSCSGNLAAANEGTTSVFDNVPCGKARYIRAYPQTRLDAGKKVTIFGIDSNGQTIRTKRTDGTFQDGVVINISVPFGSTSITVREITRVVKEETQGVVRLFQYDATGDTLHDCAVYEPTELSPNYRFTRIQGTNQRARGCCDCPDGLKQIKGLVKLQFVPVKHDDDLVLIENLDAIAMMIQGIRNREANKQGSADGLESSAIRELNLELRDKFPLEQTPIQLNPFGTALPARHMIGRIQ